MSRKRTLNTERKVPPVSISRDGTVLNLRIDFRDYNTGPAISLQDASGKFRTLEEIQADVFRAAIEAAHGNISQAARMLKVSRQTIHTWIG